MLMTPKQLVAVQAGKEQVPHSMLKDPDNMMLDRSKLLMHLKSLNIVNGQIPLKTVNRIESLLVEFQLQPVWVTSDNLLT